MSKTQIIDELLKLPAEEFAEVREWINRMPDDDWLDPELSESDKALLDEAIAAYERDPTRGRPAEEVFERLNAKYRK